jgi:hypothetical protein
MKAKIKTKLAKRSTEFICARPVRATYCSWGCDFNWRLSGDQSVPEKPLSKIRDGTTFP